jgi:hypothetical protein
MRIWSSTHLLQSLLESWGDANDDRYWAYKSQLSVDGLPGMKRGYQYAQHNKVAPLQKFIGKATPTGKLRSATQITVVQLALVGILSFIIGVLAVLTVVSPEVVRRVQSKDAWA